MAVKRFRVKHYRLFINMGRPVVMLRAESLITHTLSEGPYTHTYCINHFVIPQ